MALGVAAPWRAEGFVFAIPLGEVITGLGAGDGIQGDGAAAQGGPGGPGGHGDMSGLLPMTSTG